MYSDMVDEEEVYMRVSEAEQLKALNCVISVMVPTDCPIHAKSIIVGDDESPVRRTLSMVGRLPTASLRTMIVYSRLVH